jgi:hypothetical protein
MTYFLKRKWIALELFLGNGVYCLQSTFDHLLQGVFEICVDADWPRIPLLFQKSVRVLS